MTSEGTFLGDRPIGDQEVCKFGRRRVNCKPTLHIRVSSEISVSAENLATMTVPPGPRFASWGMT